MVAAADAPSTFGELCTDLASASCAKDHECNAGLDEAACNTDEYASCCGNDSTCGAAIATLDLPPQEVIDTCITDYSELTCEELAAGTVPAACHDL